MAEFNGRKQFNKNPKAERGMRKPFRRRIPCPDVHAGTVEYKMSKTMADEILKAAKSKGIKLTPQEILCNYVNEQCGLKGFCVNVLVDLQ